MELKDMLRALREKEGLTQDELARRLCLTRQAVSRWETGETQPGIETLKLLSKEFSVSINTLLGSPKTLVCQCCGMPLAEDGLISTEPDGSMNEDYCKWCYREGEFAYTSMQQLIDFCVPIMTEQHPELSAEEARAYMEAQLPRLKHWREEAR